MHEQKQ